MSGAPQDDQDLVTENDVLRRLIAELEAERAGSREAKAAATPLREADLEASLRAFYEASPQAIGFSRAGITVGANPAYVRLFGFDSEDELVGRSLLEQIAPASRQEILRYIETRQHGEEAPSYYETVGLRKDGSEFPFAVHVAQLPLKAGPTTMVFIDDISERKRAQEALTRSEARFRKLVEGGGEAIVVLDGAGVVRYEGGIGEKLSGYAPGERLGASGFDTISPKDYNEVTAAFHRLVEAGLGRTMRMEFRSRRKDGTEWWADVNATNLIADPDVCGVVVNFRDATTKQGALSEAIRSRSELQALLQAAEAVIESRGFEQTARSLCDAARNMIGARSGYLALLRGDDCHDRGLRIETGVEPCVVPPDLPSRIGGLRGRAFGAGRAIFENDLANSAWAALFAAGDVAPQNVLLTPLNIGGQTVGVLGLANKPGVFEPDDVRFAETIGDLASIALANHRSLARLKESEERFRDVAHALAGIVWELDEHFSVTHVSGRLREILGYDPEELVGRGADLLVASDDQEHVGLFLSQVTERRIPVQDVEFWCRAKDGRRVRVSTSAVPMIGPDGALRGLRGTSLDVTESFWSRWRRDVLLRLHELAATSDSAISAEICKACATQTESETAFFGLIEPDGAAMVSHVWSPAAESECRIALKPFRFPVAGAGLWAEPIRRREPIVINDYASAEGRGSLPEGHVALRRYLGVPIMQGDRVIAVAGLANKRSPYLDEDITRIRLLISGIADFLSSRAAERAASESDRRLRTFIDFTADWEYWRQPDGSHVYHSPACERITGYRPEEFLADPALVSRIVHADDRLAFEAHVCVATGENPAPGMVEYRVLGRHGATRWIQHMCRPVYEADGAFSGTRVSNRDITEQKAAQAALLESEARYRLIFEHSGTANAIFDSECRIVLQNSSSVALIGDARGKSLVDLFGAEHGAMLEERMRRVLETGHGETYETEFDLSGGKAWYRTTYSPVREADGTSTAVQVVSHDITDRKRTERERARLREQIHHAQKMEALGTLAGGIAHDFNNLLGGVLAGLTLLEMDLGDAAESHRTDIQEMKDRIQRGADLTKQLLGLSRRGKYEVKALDLEQVIPRTAGMFGRTRRDVTIHLDFAPELEHAMMDHSQLEQVLLNLLLNASQALPTGGDIWLRVANAIVTSEEAAGLTMDAGSYVELVVTDNGSGMDDATKTRIFEPFFTTKGPGLGTGLGLASVYGIVRNHGGSITVESSPGEGASFRILLPAVARPTEPGTEIERPVRVGQGKLLVVDDEELLLRTTARLLRRLGYEVLTAQSGAAAVELLRAHREEVSLVILDLTMPEMSGAETFDALRAITPDLKVLLVSGFTAEEQARGLLDRGCQDFIQKPFDISTLSLKLQALL